MPVILSTFSQITSVDVEHAVLMLDFALVVLGGTAAYSMALRVTDDRLIALLTSFVFSVSPVFIEMTNWTASARILIVAFFPLYLCLIFSFNQQKAFLNKELGLIFIFTLMFFASHRMAFLLGAIFASYILAKLWIKMKQNHCLSRYDAYLSENGKRYLVYILFLCAFAVQFSGAGPYRNIWVSYKTGAFASGTSIPALTLNLCTNYLGQIGLMLLLGIVGLYILLRDTNKEIDKYIIIFVLLLFTSISALGIYVAPLALSFIAILASICIVRIIISAENRFMCGNATAFAPSILSKYCRRLLAVALIACLMSCLFFSIYVVNRHLTNNMGNTNSVFWMTDDLIYAGSFLKESGKTAFVTNDGLLAWRIYAYYSIPFLSNIASATTYDLINGWIDVTELKIKPINLKLINFDVDSFYELADRPRVSVDANYFINNNSWSVKSKQICSNYRIESFVINNAVKGSIVGDWRYENIPAKSVSSLELIGTKAYDNGRLSIWEL